MLMAVSGEREIGRGRGKEGKREEGGSERGGREGKRERERERVRGTERKKQLKYMNMQLSFSACTLTLFIPS